MTTIWLPVARATGTETLQAERPYCGPPPAVPMQAVAAERARI